MKTDREDLAAMLEGYQARLQKIDNQIREVQRRLGTRAVFGVFNGPEKKKTHHISPEGLERIREAQRLRWKRHASGRRR